MQVGEGGDHVGAPCDPDLGDVVEARSRRRRRNRSVRWRTLRVGPSAACILCEPVGALRRRPTPAPSPPRPPRRLASRAPSAPGPPAVPGPFLARPRSAPAPRPARRAAAFEPAPRPLQRVACRRVETHIAGGMDETSPSRRESGLHWSMATSVTLHPSIAPIPGSVPGWRGSTPTGIPGSVPGSARACRDELVAVEVGELGRTSAVGPHLVSLAAGRLRLGVAVDGGNTSEVRTEGDRGRDGDCGPLNDAEWWRGASEGRDGADEGKTLADVRRFREVPREGHLHGCVRGIGGWRRRRESSVDRHRERSRLAVMAFSPSVTRPRSLPTRGRGGSLANFVCDQSVPGRA